MNEIQNQNEKEQLKSRLLQDVEYQEHRKLHPINFDGIIGHEDLKQEILYAVLGKLNEDEESKAYLKSIDDHAVTGILLYGLPGVGKSNILRAIEKSLVNHPDIDCKSIDCSEFQGNVGNNAKTINEKFEDARNTSKKCCIMLIDELDSVMRKKKGLLNDAERTNAMQTNMDGMKDSSKIIIIATTNTIESMEDASLSRFVVITLGLPTNEERKEFLKRYIQPIPMEMPLNIDVIVKYTEGFTGRQFRDIGKNLNRIRSISKKPISPKDLTKEIAKYAQYSGKNIIRIEEITLPNSINRTTPFISTNNVIDTITYNKENPTILTVGNSVTQLTKDILDFGNVHYNGNVNTSNIIEFSLKFVELMKPQWQNNGESGYYKPSAIRGIASKIFKLTP